MLNKNTLEWLEDRKRKNFFCRTYCGYAHDMGGGKYAACFPQMNVPMIMWTPKITKNLSVV